MSYSHTTRLVQVTVSQQDCCELQSGCQIVTGYSQATGLAWVTVQLQDCFWVTIQLQDSLGLWSGCRIAVSYIQ